MGGFFQAYRCNQFLPFLIVREAVDDLVPIQSLLSHAHHVLHGGCERSNHLVNHERFDFLTNHEILSAPKIYVKHAFQSIRSKGSGRQTQDVGRTESEEGFGKSFRRGNVCFVDDDETDGGKS